MIAPFLISALIVSIPVIGFLVSQKDFFAPIYEGLFGNVYGEYLEQHLYGWNGVDFGDPSLYIPAGFATMLIPLAAVLLFYYVINSTRFNRWYHWLIVLGITILICFGISYGLVFSDYDQGYIANDIVESITPTDLLMFGFVNLLFALLLFIGYSFALRHWSTNCSTTPLPQ